MTNPNGYPQSPESNSVFHEMLRRHNIELLRSGTYAAWIELVDRYFTGIVNSEDEQAKLSAFARSELALGASVHRNTNIHYPGVNAYFLVKVDPETGERVKYGIYGTEPIIVAHVDGDGNRVDIDGKGNPDVYSDEQVALVVSQAHEMEAAGFDFNPQCKLVYTPRPTLINLTEDIGRSVSW